ncbi:MAG: hypothetical protein IPL12_16560 [Bacteroidetes bacterium]|nr:hypothetical protein [Bacteroidota bacterium]
MKALIKMSAQRQSRNVFSKSILHKCKYFTEQEIRELNPTFDFTILRPDINANLAKENLVLLKDFPEAAKLFQSALDKLNESRFDRNLLDDLRLSLEYVAKQVLNNSRV